MIIPDPDPDFLPIPDPGSRGQKGTGSQIRIRNTIFFQANSSWTPLCAVNFSAPLATELCLYMGYSASRNYSLVRPNRTVLATSLQQSSLPEVSFHFDHRVVPFKLAVQCEQSDIGLVWGGGGWSGDGMIQPAKGYEGERYEVKQKKIFF
jgi:hypothetical protein